MFKITPKKTLAVVVSFLEPADAGSKARKCDFVVTFKKRTFSEKQEFVKALAERDKLRRKIIKLESRVEKRLANQGDDFDDFDELETELETLRADFDELDAEVRDAVLLEADTVDIDGLTDANDEPVKYSVDVLEGLLEMDYVRSAMMDEWMKINLSEAYTKGKKAKN